MIFKRKIYNELLKWKETQEGKKALLVQGARRIGKSTVVEEFAKREYESYVLINFQTDLDLIKPLFNNINNLDSFFRDLSLAYGKKLIKRKSLIIFDEVQLFPKARQSIKQLVNDGRYDFIETGSLISLIQNVQNILIPSEEKSINMYPMDFEEFLRAIGDEITPIYLRNSFNEKRSLGEVIHRKIMKDFMLYVAVGGMPQAINELLESNDFTKIDDVKRDILDLYKKDLKKLDLEYKYSTSLIFNSIPSELSSSSRLFKTVSIGKNLKTSRIYSSYEAIKESMTVNIANNCNDPNFGFNLTKDYSKQKIYMNDTGLLVSAIFKDSSKPIENSIYKDLILKKLSINLGMVMENVVAQTLVSNGYDLYFHRFDRYEIDFLISSNKKLIPIEVKSSSYSSHKSLDKFKTKYKNRVSKSYLIYGKDLKCEENITFIPFYMTMFL